MQNLLAAVKFVKERRNIIQVEPMNEEDALALLQSRIPVGDSARALVQTLGCIPLAVTQAAAYIRASQIPFSTYLQLFHESEVNQEYLRMNEEMRYIRRDPTIQHPVIATWTISFKQIQRTRPANADLLALMSMFDKEEILEGRLYDSTNRLQFEEAVATLISLSHISMQTGQQIGKRSFEMHRLVRCLTRNWLERNEQLEKWRKDSLRRVAVPFPSGSYEKWAACQLLLPHSKMVMNYLSNEEGEDENKVLNRPTIAKTAWYLSPRGEYAEPRRSAELQPNGEKGGSGQSMETRSAESALLAWF